MNNVSKIYKNAVLIFAAANVIVFALYFLFTHVEGIADTSAGYYIYVYGISYISGGLDVLFPLCAGVYLFATCSACESFCAPLRAIAIALARFLYLFPYYYLYFVYDGYDSIESCIHSALWSLIGCIIHYTVIIASLYLIKLIIRWRCKDSFVKALSSEDPLFYFDNPARFSFFATALLGFAYLFVMEAISTVSFLIEVKFVFTLPELISILLAYLVCLGFLFLFYIALCLTAKWTLKALTETS